MNWDGKQIFLALAAVVLGGVLLAKYVVFPVVDSASNAEVNSPMLAEVNTTMDISADLDSAPAPSYNYGGAATASPSAAPARPPQRIDRAALRDILYPRDKQVRKETLLIETNRLVIAETEYLNVSLKAIEGRLVLKHSGGVRQLNDEETREVIERYLPPPKETKQEEAP